MSCVAHRTSWRPIAYTAVLDEEQRRQIGDELRAAGWTVVESPTGYHLVESISGAILGDQAWRRPSLVVADAISPGCSGLSIAQGLRDLGWTTPIVLLDEPRPDALVDAGGDGSLFVVDRRFARSVIKRIARLSHREQAEKGGNSPSPQTETLET
jgi:DNA-binding response OmpR family regulator